MALGRSRSVFLGDFFKLASGATFAQILSILAAPIITRLYGPEALGISALFISISATFSVISCLRYEVALMLPKEDEDAASLLCLSLCFATLISIITIPIFWLEKDTILDLLNAPKLGPYLWIMPFSIFLNGTFMVLNYWTIRTRQFSKISLARIFNSTTTTGIQIGSGIRGLNAPGGLILAGIIGTIMSEAILGITVVRRDFHLIKKGINLHKMSAGFKRYINFPLFEVWAVLLNNLSAYMPMFILSGFFSSKVVGYYALGFMVLQFPLSIIGGSISQIFFQRAAETKHLGSLPSFVESIFSALGLIGLYPAVMLSLIGRDLFILLFGESWADAGMYVEILAFWMLIVFITSPLSSLFSILERQKNSLLINLVIITARSVALLIGCRIGDVRLALILFSAVGIVSTGWSCAWLLSCVNLSIIKLLKKYYIYLVYCLISGLMIFLIDSYTDLIFEIILLIICILSIPYYIKIYKTVYSLSMRRY